MRIGVALGSGGSAAMAQVGVLEELALQGIAVTCAAGTSGGAIVGAVFCSERLPAFHEATCSLTRRQVLRLFDPTWPRFGMLEGRRAMEFLRPFVCDRIEELPWPYAAVAVDLDTGLDMTLAKGEVLQAVRASVAVPGIVTPQRWHGRSLVDGGIVNPVPVDVARELGADFVIAINVLPLAESLPPQRPGPGARLLAPVLGLLSSNGAPHGSASQAPDDAGVEGLSPSERRSLMGVLLRASHVAECQIATMRLRDDPPDFLLSVPVPQVGLFDFQRSAELIAAGRDAARESLASLRAALEHAEPAAHRLRRWIDAARNHGTPSAK